MNLTTDILQRVFDVLLSKGRANARQLGQNTSMNQRLVRHGLAVLIQQHLIFHHTDPDTSVTQYEANTEAAYNLVRTGKILNVIHRNYGEDARDLVHQIILNGHMTVAALLQHASRRSANGKTHVKGETNGDSIETSALSEDGYDHTQQTFDLIAHLVAVGILEPLTMRMLQTPEDVRAELEHDIMKDYPTGLRGTKQKNEFNARSMQAWREVLDESKDLKRSLEADYLAGPGAKRRRLANGARMNNFSVLNRDEIIHVSGSCEALRHQDTDFRNSPKLFFVSTTRSVWLNFEVTAWHTTSKMQLDLSLRRYMLRCSKPLAKKYPTAI